MKTVARKAPIAVAFVILAGCVSTLSTPSGTRVSSDAYNREMAARGDAFYCVDGECDVAPKLLSAAAPVYPPAAVAAGRGGMAEVSFSIGPDGLPTGISVKSASAPEFGAAAVAAVRTWRYTPATLRGEPVSVGPFVQQFPFGSGP
jgi:TonB family protein